MAEIKGNALGKISGAFGGLTGRIRKGKNILAVKPSSFSQPMDDASINRRGKFKCDVLFSKAIIHLPDLKYFWEGAVTGNMSSFNLVMQTNYKLFKNNLPSPSNIIMPALGFPITPVAIDLTGSALNVTISPIGNENLFDADCDKYLKLYSIVYLSSPSDPEVDEYYFISQESAKINFQTTEQIVFNIALDASQALLLPKYNTKHIYTAVATLDEGEVPQNYSITLYK